MEHYANNNSFVLIGHDGTLKTFPISKAGIVNFINTYANEYPADFYYKRELDIAWRRFRMGNNLTIINYDYKDAVKNMVAHGLLHKINKIDLTAEQHNTIETACNTVIGITKERNGMFDFGSHIWAGVFDIHRIINLVNLYGYWRDHKEYGFQENTLEINGKFFPTKFKRYVRTCECGSKYFDQELLTEDFSNEDISRRFPSSLIGYRECCNDCVRDTYPDLDQCEDCGCWFDSCDMYYIENRDSSVCEDCVNNGDYHQCERCNDWVCTGDGDGVWTEDDCFYCSESCAERAGYHYSEGREAWIDYDAEEDEPYDEGVDSIIRGYHNDPYIPFGSFKKGQKHKLYIGRETEVDGLNRYDFDEDYFINVRNILGGEERIFFETDGSLDGGFETITQPLTVKEFFNFDWEKGFALLRGDGWRSHDTSTCGEHFHWSKWFLGYTYKQQFNSAKKIIAFFEKNWDDLVKFSRRKEHELNWCKNFGFIPDKNTKMESLSYDHAHRYFAVNLEHLARHSRDDDENGTIEIRLCKGTLNANTMLNDADFLLHIVRNAKNISWKNIDNLKLWFKGMKPTTIQYLKDRNCFVGAI